MRPSALLALLLLVAACTEINLKPLARPEAGQLAALRAAADQAYAEEDWDAAEGPYRRLTEIEPGEAENWFRLGNVYAHRDRLFDAVALYREALVHDRGHAGAWNNLALTQLRMATHSFVELRKYTEPEDPVNQRASQMIEGITGLLEVPEGTDGAASP